MTATGKNGFIAMNRAAFHTFYNDNFSEELYNQHYEQLLKMKLYYDENKLLYNEVHKWKAFWDQFIQLEGEKKIN